MIEKSTSSNGKPAADVDALSLDEARALLDRLASAETLRRVDDEGRTPLMRAIEADDAPLVAFLAPRSDLLSACNLARRGNETRDSHMATPLMRAAALGHEACVAALLRQQAEEQCGVGDDASNPMPAIDWAIKGGNAECARLIAPFSKLKERQRRWPLIEAAGAGRLDLLEILAPHCDAGARDERGMTALVAAAGCRAPNALDCFLFLAAQPDVKMAPEEPDSAKTTRAKILFAAIRADNAEIVREIAPHFDLNQAAYANDVYWVGLRTPLFQAVVHRAEKSFDFLLPRSEASIEERCGRWNGGARTAQEQALENVWESPQGRESAIRMADALTATLLRQGRPLDLAPAQCGAPPFSQEWHLEQMPKTRAWIEAQALLSAVQDGQGAQNEEERSRPAPPRL